MQTKHLLLCLLFFITTGHMALAQACIGDPGILPAMDQPLVYEIATPLAAYGSMASQDAAADAGLDANGTTVPYASLKGAFAAATAAVASGASGSDIMIVFLGGRYITDNTVWAAFDIDITDPAMNGLTIHAAAPAVVDNQKAGAVAFIDITGVDDILINGVSPMGFSETDGSAFAITDAQNITLSNCKIEDNTGGTALVVNSLWRETRMKLINVELNNHASFPSETAMSIMSSSNASAAINTYVDFINTSFSCNTRDKFGGALDITNPRGNAGPGPVVNFYGGFFYGNSGTGGACDGGAIYITGNSTMTLNKTDFYYNLSESANGESGGGAIAIENNSTVTINGSLFEGNSTYQYGGAILVDGDACTLTVNDAIFKGNSALKGAAIQIGADNTERADVDITNSLFYENDVTGYNSLQHHGTIFIDAEESGAGTAIDFVMTNSTIANNTRASTSGTETAGLYIYGSRNNPDTDPDSDVITIQDCIMWGNTGKDLYEYIIEGFLEADDPSVVLLGANTIGNGNSNKSDNYTQGSDPMFTAPASDNFVPTVGVNGYAGGQVRSANPAACELIPEGEEPCPKRTIAVLPSRDFIADITYEQVYVAFDTKGNVKQVSETGDFAVGSAPLNDAQSGYGIIYDQNYAVYAFNYLKEDFPGDNPYQALTTTPRNLSDFLALSGGASLCLETDGPVAINAENCCIYDKDKDGICDEDDIDDDNDGIPDVVELGFPQGTDILVVMTDDPSRDFDNDGILNYMDIDFCALNSAGVCATMDLDRDGIPNFLDLDSDNDGIQDVIEAGGIDNEGNGQLGIYVPIDLDRDGLADMVDVAVGIPLTTTSLPIFNTDGVEGADFLDLDSDNDGIQDIVEVAQLATVDLNIDGMVDNFDVLSPFTFDPIDNDGWSSIYDGDNENDFEIDNNNQLVDVSLELDVSVNMDTKSYANHQDLDADGDGIVDIVEAGGEDNNGDGMVDSPTDLNGNGWADNIESVGLPLFNTDGMGGGNWLDIDSDDDGITDNVEGQSTNGFDILNINDGLGGFLVIEDLDDDNDGIDNAYDNNRYGYGGSGLNKNVAMGARYGAHDYDRDGKPDYIDDDSDNDGTPDRVEGHDLNQDGSVVDNLPCTVLTDHRVPLTDADNDGMLDCYDDPDPSPDPRRVGSGTGNCPLGPGCTPEDIVPGDLDSQPDFRDVFTNVLPLELLSFTATNEDCQVHLNWTSFAEVDVAYFSVEKSTDGLTFRSFDQVLAVGNTDAETNYTTMDLKPNYLNYYRLKMVDIDGSFQYSDLVTLKYDCYRNATITGLYPVPVRQELTVDFYTEMEGEGRMLLSDMLGRELLSETITYSKGITTKTLELSDLPVGVYFISLEIDGELTAPQRFIKTD